MDGCAPLCSKNFQVIAVGGFKASLEEVEESGWRFYAFLHDLSSRHKKEHLKNIQLIVNSSNSLSSVAKEDVLKLQGCVSNMERCSDGMTCVIFAHSHAAKVVCEALGDEGLKSFFGPVENLDETISDIRENLAIFTYGGIDNVPKQLGKIAVNLRLKKDVKAAVGKSFFGQSTDAVEVYLDGDKSPVVTESTHLTLRGIARSLRSVFASATEHLPHAYLDNMQFMQYISDTLLLNVRKCACSSAALPDDNVPYS